ncbi:SLBB domain-containing protein [Bacteroides fragilis]|nr:SLBB domain-containing protein [Bacteroides fragilis]MCE8593413.1 SLBB domain-containing protein [Bacteroides fragilis]MCE8656373.1 SLBB domain-containing protein [Bacteroides fragilis]MCE8661605.1 SLBB domain-containing protein [Bacteroides fragilis]MCM0262044.1 SLBB domain-containing protein [Bacteroides fragilis]
MDKISGRVNDKGALLFALFILLAGGSRARQHRKEDFIIRGKQVAVFGRNIFTDRNLSFEPNLDIPTPENYVLGPGDELIIDVWGTSENTVREIISPEGTIHVAGIGPIFLDGMSIQDAERSLRREFSKIYAAISGKSVHIKLSLGGIRTIMINVMGEVQVPGTYRLSAFASVFHALYRAGGVSGIGSLRDIRVVRGGKEVACIDVYDYIMKGKLTDDIRLSEGDVILIPPYENLVSISGKVKRPMAYEMKKGETITTLLSYAGGFTGDAYRDAIRLFRLNGKEKQIYNVGQDDYQSFVLTDGDELSVEAVLQRFSNKVEVRGAVYRAGVYQLDDSITGTVRQLISRAEGLRGDAFLNRALLRREHEDLTHEMIPVDLKRMMAGAVSDLRLQKNDVLYISSVKDIEKEGTLSIYGDIRNPGDFPYVKNTSIQDLIVKAGGLLESASMVRIDVSRRIRDPKSISSSTVIGKSFAVELKNGLVMGEDKGFELEPYDIVFIRRSPGYRKQANVTVEGEVAFTGNYTLIQSNERLSSLIARAGGLSKEAYVKGARLIRRMTADEMRQKNDVLRLSVRGSEKASVSPVTLEASSTYPVGIELEKALVNPGSDEDMVLREGDVLFVPKYVSTVTINGAVMYPNTILYQKGSSLSYYIEQAGGFGNRALKRRVYVIYMNGMVSRLKRRMGNAIEPGCEIIVPSKKGRKKTVAADVTGMNTSIASIAAMVAAMVGMTK